jgi:hypothetical protein
LKKKAAGWLMALARIAVLNPELFQAAMADARRTYSAQVKDEYPWVSMVDHMVGLEPRADRDYGIRVHRYEVAEGSQSAHDEAAGTETGGSINTPDARSTSEPS